jgi:hypothetical protein
MKCIILLVLFLSVSVGCKQVVDQRVVNPWSVLRIISEEDTQITINNNEDTSMVNVYHRGSFFAPLPKNTKVKIDTFKAYFTKAEKDTIFSLVEDLIQHPAKTNKFCTDYVGSLDLVIVYGEQFKQRGEYSSVCDWNTLSAKTIQLHGILKRKMKKIYLGEQDPI